MSSDSEVRGRVIETEMRTQASPEAVYAAWADPAQLAQWFVDGARGEARAGETVVWHWAAFALDVPYDVLEAEPGRRLVLCTPAQVAPPGIIEITIRRDGGETVLTLVNSGFLDGPEWDELMAGVRSGWTLALALLREYLEHYAGRAKRTFVHMRPAHLDFATLMPWFTDAAHLRRWLTTSGAPAPAPHVEPLVLRDGTRIRASIIARTERELMLSLPDEEAILELKAFTAPMEPATAQDDAPMLRPARAPQRIACLRGTSWTADEARFEWLRVTASDALDRLVVELER